MRPDSPRWTQVTPSQFAHEREALDHIRDLLPDAEPYRAWANFTFTAHTGHVYEVDLLVAARSGLYLIEIKSWSGRVVNSDSNWLLQHGHGGPIHDNPLHLTDAKAKRLKSRLDAAASKLGIRWKVPRVHAAVFMSNPSLKVALDEVERAWVFGREKGSELPGIGSGLLLRPPKDERLRIDATISKQLPALLRQAGIARSRRYFKVGELELKTPPFDDGPTWQDYLAKHTQIEGLTRRVRVYLVARGASEEARQSIERAARREVAILNKLDHPGIVRAYDFAPHDAGPAIVFDHDERAIRLDHYMAQHGGDLDAGTRLEMLDQLVDAVAYAHGQHVHHRGLAARSVWASPRDNDGRRPELQVSDWQAAERGVGEAAGRTTHPILATTHAAEHIERSAEAYLAPESSQPGADGVALDVFGLGVLSYLIFTGSPPAAKRPELLSRLSAENGLQISAVVDAPPTALDDLVQEATRPIVSERLPSVEDFRAGLALVEEELTAPRRTTQTRHEPMPEIDPLDAGPGAIVGEWKVKMRLGTGSTSRALLVTPPDGDSKEYVLKIARDEEKAQRLDREAALLSRLNDSRIVRLVRGAFTVGGRTVILLERAGETTLARKLREEGACTIDELQRFGDDLFAAADYLDGEGVTHRDIKPDNLGIRRLANQARRVVLFDFSLAGTDARNTAAGTTGYLDPFIGTAARPTFDAQAEWFAVAVTLHELASGELPVWGDGQTEPRYTEGDVQVAAEAFEPALRDDLVDFFGRALHREAKKRYSGLQEMKAAWHAMFARLDAERPVTTSEEETTEQARAAAAEAATPTTPLEAAGLTPRAVSAGQRLGASTVGQLLALPPKNLWTLRGLGAGTRRELVRRVRQWRERLGVNEQPPTRTSDGERPPTIDRVVPKGAPTRERVDAADLFDTMSLDGVVAELLPRRMSRNVREYEIVRTTLGLPDEVSGAPTGLPPWPTTTQVAARLGVSQPRITNALGPGRRRWADSPVVRALAAELVALLTDSGRVMGLAEAADAMLGDRGSTRTGFALRRQLGVAAVRGAVEADGLKKDALFRIRRHGDRILIALEGQEGDLAMPSAEELLDYADRLGRAADNLARSEPLPSAANVIRRLRDVSPVREMPLLSEQRLVHLAVSASENAAATPRLEIYPLDLPPERALRLSQAGFATDKGIAADEVHERVRARFPSLQELPKGPALERLLNSAGFDVVWRDGRYVPRGATVTSATSLVTRVPTGGGRTPAVVEETAATVVERRLASAAKDGGYRALTVQANLAEAALRELQRFGAEPVDVTARFVATVRATAKEVGVTDWDRVYATDKAGPEHPEWRYLQELARRAWGKLERELLDRDGLLLLHGAGPMVRYDGMDSLNRVAAAGRTGQRPRGVWLLCPQRDHGQSPRLDGTPVEIVTENEWITLPPDWVANKHRGVSGVAS
jgi:serine/threonine protein kinase